MSKSYGKASAQAVGEFEQKFGIQLHDQYKQFLFEHNGGRADVPSVSIGNWGITVVNTFYGVGLDTRYDLEEVLDRIDHFPVEVALPIADDPGGNIFLIGTEEGNFGKILFWDHAEWPDDKEPVDTLIEVAADFSAFISACNIPD